MYSITVCSFLTLIIFLRLRSINCLTNSDNVSFGTYNYTVQVISFYSPGIATGSGIVITPKCAVTVGHIALDAIFTIIRQGNEAYPAKAVHGVPGYNLNFPPLYHDICVIELLFSIPTLSKIKPCPIRSLYQTRLSPGANLTAFAVDSGVTIPGFFGLVGEEELPVGMALQRGYVQVVPNDSEPRNWPEMQLEKRLDYFLMKGSTSDGKAIVAEGGDSGGPVLYNGVLCGLISFGITDASLGQPSGCTNISFYHDWLRSEIDRISPEYLI